MQRTIQRLLHIRPGEWRAVLLLQLQIFLIIAVLLIAKPAANALYLSRFGSAALPYMYILTAVAAAIVSTSYAAALRYYSVLRINLWSLGISLASLLCFSIMVGLPGFENIVSIGLYLWVALFGVLSASQFWMIANLVFDLRQAKRLFGPIGAGAIAGGITGGYLANIIASSAGTRPLLFVASLLLLPCIFISIYVWKHYINDRKASLREKKTTSVLRELPHRLILGSRHLVLLGAIIALSVIAAKLVDYQFSAMAAERYANQDRLTAFFGFWFSTFNLIGFFIQLLLTQRVVQLIGVSGALLFLPAGLSLGAVLMFFMPGLGAATFSRLTDGSLKQSLHRAALEMLFLPVSAEVKHRIKTYIDVFVDSAAGGLGGLLLLLLVEGLDWPATWMSAPVLVITLVWLGCVILIREEYLDAFRNQLRPLVPKKKQSRLKSKHKEVLAGFLEVLQNRGGTEKEQKILYVLERTEELGDERFEKSIRDLLDHPSPMVRARSLRSLSLLPRGSLFDRVVPLLKAEEKVVRNAAAEYLITHHLLEAGHLIDEQLQSRDPKVAGPILVFLFTETRGNPSLRQRWYLDERLRSRIAALPQLPVSEQKDWMGFLIRAAGRAETEEGKSFVLDQLNHPDPSVRREAIIAAGESLDEAFLLPLIDFLSEAPFRPHARAALVQYDQALVELLPTYFKRDIIEMADVRRLPVVLEAIGNQSSVDLLFSMIERYYPEDLELRLETLKALNAIRRDYPELNMGSKKIFRHILSEANTYQKTIEILKAQRIFLQFASPELHDARASLTRLLQQRLEGNLDRLFRLLGLRYPPRDIIPVFRGLHSVDRRQQINAVEFLDNLLENPLKRILIPLVEIRLNEGEEEMEPYQENTLAELEERQYHIFVRILSGRDHRMKLSVLYLIGFLREARYGKLLKRYSRAENPAISGTARRALRRYRQASLLTKE